VVIENTEEKYGTNSLFFEINKNEEPTFLHAYKRALNAVKVSSREHILNLGINKADEFELIERIIPSNKFNTIQFSGVDHSQSALEFARERFPQDNMHFYQTDINKLSQLNLPKADLIISIGTLQSPTINYKPFLMSLVQEHLTENGAFILGFPNSRWIDNELIYGAKAPNYPYSEMSLLYNDVMFAKKYLQQKKFRVTLTGREYIFLTATRIGV
jgi:trans-aconitate methyltransferase